MLETVSGLLPGAEPADSRVLLRLQDETLYFQYPAPLFVHYGTVPKTAGTIL